jgi:hypothetical protein
VDQITANAAKADEYRRGEREKRPAIRDESPAVFILRQIYS